MTFLEPYKKYATIAGRATRKEFWVYSFFLTAITPLFLAVDYFLFSDGQFFLTSIFYAFSTIPSFTVIFRRLHDTDRSAWWSFVGLVPLLGSLLLIYFLSLDSTPGDNRFGKQPLKIYTPRSFVLQLVFWVVGILLVGALWLIVGSLLSELSTNGSGLSTNEEPKLEDRNGVIYLPNHDEPYTGQHIIWYENGQDKSDGTYKDGKKDGLWTYWNEKKEGTYKDGKKEGLWTQWDEQGNIIKQTTYKNGVEVLSN